MSSKSHSFWYTSLDIVKKIYSVLGSITIDPTSSSEANARICADFIYTLEDSCLKPARWLPETPDGAVITCFMNPPYSSDCGGTKPYTEKLIEQMDKGVIDVSIVLTNASTSANWFQSLMKDCDMVCFPSKRICFEEDLDYVREFKSEHELEDSDKGIRKGKSPRYDNAIFLLFAAGTKCNKEEYKQKFLKEFGSKGTILMKTQWELNELYH